MYRLRDRNTANKILSSLKKMDLNMRVMHVCGTHQDTLIRHGLETLLAEVGIDVREGPGCPVCVTTTKEMEEILLLARRGKSITVYGDMLRAPGHTGSLASVRTEGAEVHVVYSIEDAVSLAKEHPEKEVVFMGVGFETTMPSSAVALMNDPPENFSILSVHKLTPPAVGAVIDMGELRLDGIIDPGHVSTVIGRKPWIPITEKHKLPQVIAGFEPLDLLMGIYMLAKQVVEGRADVEIEYTRAVSEDGNRRAIEAINEVFETTEASWRGLGTVPESGMNIRKKYEDYDAMRKYEDVLEEIKDAEFPDPEGCRCGEVIRGVLYPHECPLFGRVCTPSHPVGPCMVSVEGGCAIEYKYKVKRSLP